MHAWKVDAGRRFLADIIVNIAIYVPLGMSGYLAFRKHRILSPMLLAVVLSASIEMVQLFVPSRNCSAIDWIDNVIGAAAGVGLGKLFEQLAGPQLRGLVRRKAADKSALALLFCWVGFLLFPLFPVMGLPVYRAKLAAFAGGPWFAIIPLVSYAAAWFVGGRLLLAAGVLSAEIWLAISLLMVPGQFLIVSRQPLPVDILASVTGFLVFLAWGRREGMEKILAGVFLAVLTIRGLAPFQFIGASQEFVWVPFGGFLNMNWQAGVGLLLEKAFYYGAAVWLVRAAGTRWRTAITAVAILLAGIEVAQMHLPGRTAEITDPVLAVLVGLGLRVLTKPSRQIAR